MRISLVGLAQLAKRCVGHSGLSGEAIFEEVDAERCIKWCETFLKFSVFVGIRLIARPICLGRIVAGLGQWKY